MRKNLKEARQRAGMTQQEMADKLEINIRHYQKIESGDEAGRISRIPIHTSKQPRKPPMQEVQLQR